MVTENIIKDILTYLKKAGPTNTFRLATKTGLERAKLLNILKKLEEKQAIRFECGNAIFIKFVSEEKLKPAKIKEISKPKKEIKNKQQIKKVKSTVKRKPATPKALQLLQTENIQLKDKLLELERAMKELEKKASARPKTRTITKTIIKKVPVTKIIIRKVPVIKTVIKNVPTIKTIVKKIIVPLPPLKNEKNVEKSKNTKENVWEKLKIHSKKFKSPNFKLLKSNFKLLKNKKFKFPKFTFMKNIKQLKKPEFVK